MSLIYLAVCWFAGLWLAATTGGIAGVWLVVAAALALFAVFRRWRVGASDHSGALALACLAALFAGGGRYLLAHTRSAGPEVAAYEGEHVSLTGTIVEEPLARDESAYWRLRVNRLAPIGGAWRAVQGEIRVQAGRYFPVNYGTELRLTGRLQMPDGEWGEWLARQGYDSTMVYPRVTILGRGAGNPFREALIDLRAQARAVIHRILPDPAASLLVGILLGDDSGLSRQVHGAFRTTGLSHIIAISGFNITLLAGMLLALARPFLRPRPAAAVSLVGVALYTILVGADPAVVRAAIMGGIFLGTRALLGRPTFPFASLFLSGVLMTAVKPGILWDVGFQLSFAATLGLMLYSKPLTRWTRAQLVRYLGNDGAQRVTRAISDTVLVTLAAQITTVPLLVYHFGTLSLASLPANVLVLPAQSGVMLWGGLATLAGLALPALGQLLAWPAWLFLGYSLWMVETLAGLPLAAITLQIGPAGLFGSYFVLATITWVARRAPGPRRQMVGGLRATSVLGAIVLAALLAWQWAATQPDGLLHLHFLDGAQGGVIFIQTPDGRQLLVNGGPDATMLNEKLGRLIPFWDRSVDLVIATTPSAERSGALPAFFDRYRVARLLANGTPADGGLAWATLLDKAKTEAEVAEPTAGETYVLDENVRLEILAPDDRSLPLRLVYGEFAMRLGASGAESLSDPPVFVIWSQVEPVPVGSEGRVLLSTEQLGALELITDGERVWWQATRPMGGPP